jgi:lipopolysaccharide/colanic/teichoic acid biosynthesis glycosyltransferase
VRHRFLLTLADLALIALATVGAQLLRDNFEIRSEQLAALLPYLGLTLAISVPMLAAFGLNRSIWRMSAMPDYTRVMGAAILIVTAAVVLGFVSNRLNGVARSLPVIQVGLLAFGLVAVRVLARWRHDRRRPGPKVSRFAPGASEPPETILLVGVNRISELYLRSLAEFAGGQVRVAGLLDPRKRHIGRLVQEHQILGGPEAIERILWDLAVHGIAITRIVVAVAFDTLSPAAQNALLAVERRSSVKLEFFAENIGIVDRSERPRSSADASPGETREDPAAFRIEPSEIEALSRRPYWRVKRAMDLAGSMCALVLLAPIMLLVGVLVVFDIGLPIVFWQQRPGVGGHPFRLLKFRTMGNPHAPGGRRISDAERLSLIGHLLRRFRLDELPQLFNVLMGEMSFVGPRPLLPKDQFPALAARLAIIRPGLTGWAQIKGGRTLTPSDKAALDVWYVRNGSLWIDLAIAAGTLRMILLGERTDLDAIREAWRELGGDKLGYDSRSRKTTVEEGRPLLSLGAAERGPGMDTPVPRNSPTGAMIRNSV